MNYMQWIYINDDLMKAAVDGGTMPTGRDGRRQAAGRYVASGRLQESATILRLGAGK